MSKITEKVAALARPVVEEEGCTLWDVEYVREAGTWYLRIFVDKEGGLSIDDCERISRRLDPMLDEADPIPDSYTFEVCSAGLERTLKRPGDFERFLGADVLVRLYRPRDGAKEFAGVLKGYDGGDVTVEVGGAPITFTKAEIAQVRLRVDF